MSVSKQLVQTARNLRLKKGLSQNFLVDTDILEQIAQEVSHSNTALPLVEIGPGAGFLTERLLGTGHPLTAIEVDPKMIKVLEERYGNTPQFQLIHQNVLHVDLGAFLKPQGIIVGNLPYHLTGPILFQIIGELADAQHPLRQQLIKAVLMVQKEVGERLAAAPGESSYGQLTIQAQFWFTVTPVVLVPKTAFYPSPKVDSMVVALTPRPEPAIAVDDLSFFSRLVKDCFTHRRKTLLNNLKISRYGPEDELKSLLVRLNIPPERRPQELSLEQFGALANALCCLR